MNISNKDKIAVKKLLNVADRINNCAKCTVKPIAKEHMCEECYAEHCQWLSELSAPKQDSAQWYTLYEIKV